MIFIQKTFMFFKSFMVQFARELHSVIRFGVFCSSVKEVN